MTSAYASASFLVYAEALEGVDEEFIAAAPASADATVAPAVDAYRAALPAISSPCLEAGCDWSSQVSALDAAAQRFLDAEEEG